MSTRALRTVAAAAAAAAVALNAWLLWPLLTPDTWWVLSRDLPAGAAVTSTDLRAVTGPAGSAPTDTISADAVPAGNTLRLLLRAGQPVPVSAMSVPTAETGQVTAPLRVDAARVAPACTQAGTAISVWRFDTLAATGPIVTGVQPDQGGLVLTVTLPGRQLPALLRAGTEPGALTVTC